MIIAVVSSVKVDVAWLTPIVAVFLPILIALVTTKLASPALKAWLLAALAVVLSIASSALANGGTIVLKQTIINGLVLYVISIATYYGLWKPTGVAAKVQNVTPNVGLGTKQQEIGSDSL